MGVGELMAFFRNGALVERFASIVTSAGLTSLTKNSTTFQFFTGSTTHTVKLPDATTCDGVASSGTRKFYFFNRSTGVVTITDNASNVLGYLNANTDLVVTLTDNSTAAGVWRIASFSPQEMPLKLSANTGADSKIKVTSNVITNLDGTETTSPPLSNTISSIVESTHDLQTGATTGSTFTGATIPTTTIGNYRRAGYSLLSDGSIQVAFTNEAATEGALENAGTVLSADGLPIGWVDLVATGANAFKTIGSATAIIENNVAGVSRIHRFGSGGGAGGATSDSAPRSVAGGFSLMMSNGFKTNPTAVYSQVDTTVTNATWNSATKLFAISCENLVTVTTTGTSFTLNTPVSNFTVKAGDIIYQYSTGSWRRILTIVGLSGTLDAAFSVDLAASSCMVSQALWTNDLVNVGSATELNRPRDFYPSTSILTANVYYEDSKVVSDNIPDLVSTARVVVSASNSGLQSDTGLALSNTFSSIFTRSQAPSQWDDYVLSANANTERLFLCFFPNPADTSLSLANILRYDCSFYSMSTLTNGGLINSAYAYNDGSTTEVNSLAPVNVLGLTQWQLTFPYIMNVNSGTTFGDLIVEYDGKTVPRFLAGALDPGDLYFTELSPFLIQFSQDIITAQPTLSLSAKRTQGLNDQSVVNNLKLNKLLTFTVGTAQDVADGVASYTSLQTAVTAAPSGSRIVVLNGVSITEAVSIAKRLTIEGWGGYDSLINGVVTLASGCSFSTLKNFRVSQFVFNSGADGNIIQSCFWSTDPSDSGLGNTYTGVNIT